MHTYSIKTNYITILTTIIWINGKQIEKAIAQFNLMIVIVIVIVIAATMIAEKANNEWQIKCSIQSGILSTYVFINLWMLMVNTL